MNGKIFQRRKNAFVLQLRDAGIIKTVFHWRVLTGSQIKVLCGFKSQKRANDRLRKLFDGGYLSRRLFVSAYKREILYFIGPGAIDFLAAETGTDSSLIRRRRTNIRKTRDSFVSHFRLINNFRFSLKIVSQADPRIAIEAWRYKPPLFLNEKPTIFPDASLRIRHGEKDLYCFLEIDRSVESRKRIMKKIESYLDYGLDGGCEKQFGCKYFRLLIVCKTSARLKTLAKLIGKTTDKSFCWLTVEKNLCPEKILSPVWSRPNKEGEFSLP